MTVDVNVYHVDRSGLTERLAARISEPRSRTVYDNRAPIPTGHSRTTVAAATAQSVNSTARALYVGTHAHKRDGALADGRRGHPGPAGLEVDRLPVGRDRCRGRGQDRPPRRPADRRDIAAGVPAAGEAARGVSNGLGRHDEPDDVEPDDVDEPDYLGILELALRASRNEVDEIREQLSRYLDQHDALTGLRNMALEIAVEGDGRTVSPDDLFARTEGDEAPAPA